VREELLRACAEARDDPTGAAKLDGELPRADPLGHVASVAHEDTERPPHDVDPAEREGGTTGIKIPRLTNFLAALHHEEEAARARQPGYDPNNAPPAELLIIADRTTPYRLLIEVLFSAKQKEAGYKHFRLIVSKSFPPGPAAKK